jgi:hypothetical protein
VRGGVNLYGFVGNDTANLADYLGMLKIEVGDHVVTNDLEPGKSQLRMHPGAGLQRVIPNSEGVTVIEYKITPTCRCEERKRGGKIEKKWILEKYHIVIFAHVHLMQKDRYKDGEEHYEFTQRNEMDHVSDFEEWGKSDEVKRILTRIEETQKKGDRPGKRFDSEEKCIEGSVQAVINNSRLGASANKAIHLSISRWDEGTHIKHKWRGPQRK